ESTVDFQDAIPVIDDSMVELSETLEVEESTVDFQDAIPVIDDSMVELSETLEVEESTVDFQDSIPVIDDSMTGLPDTLEVEESTVDFQDVIPVIDDSMIELSDTLEVTESDTDLQNGLLSLSDTLEIEESQDWVPVVDDSMIELLDSLEVAETDPQDDLVPLISDDTVEQIDTPEATDDQETLALTVEAIEVPTIASSEAVISTPSAEAFAPQTPDAEDSQATDSPLTIDAVESQQTVQSTPEPIVDEAPPVMEVDDGTDEILEIFLEEAEEIIESVDQILSEWRANPENLVNVAHLQRDLHTLKGGARMAEQADVAALCHDLETLYERINNGRLGVEPGLFSLLQAAHDDLGGQLDSIRYGQTPRSADSILSSLKAYMQGEVVQNPDADSADEPDMASDTNVAAKPDQNVEHKVTPVAADQVLSESLDETDREILEIFLDEAAELYEALDQALQEWEKTPTNMEPANEAQRVLHTFKGGARLAGLVTLGDQAHAFESRILQVQQGYLQADPEFFKSAYQEQDALARQIEQIGTMLASGEMLLLGDDSLETVPRNTPSNQADSTDTGLDETTEARQPSDSSVKGQETPPAATVSEPAVVAPVTPEAATESAAPQDTSVASNVVPLRTTQGTPVAAASVPASVAEAAQQVAARKAPQELVKVSADLLDDLVNLAGETSIGRGRLEQQVTDFSYTLEEMEGTLDRLRDQLRRLDIETEAQVLFRQERHGPEYEDFDPLEMDRYSTIQQLSRGLVESASDLLDLKDTLSNKTRDAETLLLQQSRVNTELQEGLMKTRMVPFQRLVPRLRRIVRQVSLELDKQVEFQVLNAEGELDRSLLERMISPLEHMVRNAVDHGIESIAERRAAGKPDVGSIDLEVSREGSDVVLTLRDDGKGINRDAVRAKAIERGLLTEDARITDHDLLQFILQAGFSTAANVTQISGRGVGLDVVSTEIKQMGGTVEILSEQGAGTRFVVRLPFTVSVNRALMVQIGDDLYAIPLNNIQGIVRASSNELQGYYQMPPNERQYQYSGQDYRLEYLGVMLENGSQPKVTNQTLPLPILLIKGTVPYALQVDSLLGSREIVVKALGPQFASVMGVSGGTILGDGSVVIILDLPAMIRSQTSLEYQQARLLDAQMAEQRHEQVAKVSRVLVVDDSVTVRKVTTRLLERHGLEVYTASDGVDAMATLQDHKPDLMLLDIEMPRMDGFEVASLVRHDQRLKDIPIVMITSRTGDKHRDRAMAIGVNEYLGKPFQEESLMGTINRLLGREGR
ncbi:Hpt domain-containing protein, partial [Oceanobacter sp. 1_MG-2023]|uniref:hybrid sensor histidine kinase/response regulator n=2 Tax=unclassified Oceanobacter TaxID=2620260 RepID=UPI002732FCB9